MAAKEEVHAWVHEVKAGEKGAEDVLSAALRRAAIGQAPQHHGPVGGPVFEVDAQPRAGAGDSWRVMVAT